MLSNQVLSIVSFANEADTFPLWLHMAILILRTFDGLACMFQVLSPPGYTSPTLQNLQQAVGFLSLEGYLHYEGASVSIAVLAGLAGFHTLFLGSLVWLFVASGRGNKQPRLLKAAEPPSRVADVWTPRRLASAWVRVATQGVTRATGVSAWLIFAAHVFCVQPQLKAACETAAALRVTLASVVLAGHLAGVLALNLLVSAADPFDSCIFSGRSKAAAVLAEAELAATGLFFGIWGDREDLWIYFLWIRVGLGGAKLFIESAGGAGIYRHFFCLAVTSSEIGQWALALFGVMNHWTLDGPLGLRSALTQVVASAALGVAAASWSRDFANQGPASFISGQKETRRVAELLCMCLRNKDTKLYADKLSNFALEHRLGCGNSACGCRGEGGVDAAVSSFFSKAHERFPRDNRIYLLGIFLEMEKIHLSASFVLRMEPLARLPLSLFDRIFVARRKSKFERELKRLDFEVLEPAPTLLDRVESTRAARTAVDAMRMFLVNYVLLLEELAEGGRAASKNFKLALELSGLAEELRGESKMLDPTLEALLWQFRAALGLSQGVGEGVDGGKIAGLPSWSPHGLLTGGVLLVFSVGKESFGQMTFASHSAPAMLGHSVEALRQMKVNDLMPAAFAAEHDRLLEVHLARPAKLRRIFKQKSAYALDSEGFLVNFSVRGKLFPCALGDPQMVGHLTPLDAPKAYATVEKLGTEQKEVSRVGLSLADSSRLALRGAVLLNARSEIIGVNRFAEDALNIPRMAVKSDRALSSALDEFLDTPKLTDMPRGLEVVAALRPAVRRGLRAAVSLVLDAADAPPPPPRKVRVLLEDKYALYPGLSVLRVDFLSDQEGAEADRPDQVQQVGNSIDSSKQGETERTNSARQPLNPIIRVDSTRKALNSSRRIDSTRLAELNRLLSSDRVNSRRFSQARVLHAVGGLLALFLLVLASLQIFAATRDASISAIMERRNRDTQPVFESLAETSLSSVKLWQLGQLNLTSQVDAEVLVASVRGGTRAVQARISSLESVEAAAAHAGGLTLTTAAITAGDDVIPSIDTSEDGMPISNDTTESSSSTYTPVSCSTRATSLTAVGDVLAVSRLIAQGVLDTFSEESFTWVGPCLLQVFSSELLRSLPRSHLSPHHIRARPLRKHRLHRLYRHDRAGRGLGRGDRGRVLADGREEKGGLRRLRTAAARPSV